MYRLRSIGFTLFVSLTLTTLGAVLMLALLFWISLGSGFSNYVAELELTRLDAVEDYLVKGYQQHQNWQFLHSPRDLMPQQEALEQEDVPKPEKTQRQEKAPRPNEDDARPPNGEPPRNDQPPPPRADEPYRSLTPRLALLDTNGILVMGRHDIKNRPRRPVNSPDGKLIGFITLAPATDGDDQLVRNFLTNQIHNIILSAIIAIILSALAAAWLARHFRKPIAALAEGAQQLAAGQLHARVQLNRKDELGELAQDFNRMAQKLERFEEARRQWVADTSHELRTPLTILRAHTEAMRDGVMPLDQRGIGRIESAIVDLDRLVADLYQLARADIGMHEYLFENINLAELFTDLIDQFNEPMRQAGLALEITCSVDLTVRGDSGRLHQLFTNLLSNSMRYTKTGGLVKLSAKPDNTFAEIFLDDTPPGVPDAALPLLFDRFYRVDASHNRRTGGSGLGLSICQTIVTGHGGNIIAQHSPLGGLQIKISLPLAEKRT